PFLASPGRKWNNSTITWYQYGNPQHSDLIEKAFDVWGKYANITFKKDFKNPIIMISFSNQQKHFFYSRNEMCYYDFDGPGGVLAHAFLPAKSLNRTDIHLDSEENWDFTMDLPQGGNISFFHTIVHEIGHALGLDHSGDVNSIMYPVYNIPGGIANLSELDLSRDDILGIQFLYGQPLPTTVENSNNTSSTTSTTTTSTTTTTTTTTVAPPQLVEQRDICELKYKINKFLIVNRKIYAF